MKTSEKFEYLCKKINWGSSFLDAKAVECLNTIRQEIIEMERKQ